MKAEIIKFERYREQFKFLREHGIGTEADMQVFHAGLEERLSGLTKQRTILNVQKKRRKKLFDALADETALAVAPLGTDEHDKYLEAIELLDSSGISRETLSTQKSELYTKIADINREIRQVRKEIKMCQEIGGKTSDMECELRAMEPARARHGQYRKVER